MRYGLTEALADGWREPEASRWVDWRERVNQQVLLIAGCEIDDLPDYDLASAFENGGNVEEVAFDLVREAWDY